MQNINAVTQIYWEWCRQNMEMYAPMVVTTVVEKNNACPKLQFGSLVAFRNADTPLLLAFSTSAMNFSMSSSARRENVVIIFAFDERQKKNYL